MLRGAMVLAILIFAVPALGLDGNQFWCRSTGNLNPESYEMYPQRSST